jgi:hypothetical protein
MLTVARLAGCIITKETTDICHAHMGCVHMLRQYS